MFLSSEITPEWNHLWETEPATIGKRVLMALNFQVWMKLQSREPTQDSLFHFVWLCLCLDVIVSSSALMLWKRNWFGETVISPLMMMRPKPKSTSSQRGKWGKSKINLRRESNKPSIHNSSLSSKIFSSRGEESICLEQKERGIQSESCVFIGGKGKQCKGRNIKGTLTPPYFHFYTGRKIRAHFHQFLWDNLWTVIIKVKLPFGTRPDLRAVPRSVSNCKRIVGMSAIKLFLL